MKLSRLAPVIDRGELGLHVIIIYLGKWLYPGCTHNHRQVWADWKLRPHEGERPRELRRVEQRVAAPHQEINVFVDCVESVR